MAALRAKRRYRLVEASDEETSLRDKRLRRGNDIATRSSSNSNAEDSDSHRHGGHPFLIASTKDERLQGKLEQSESMCANVNNWRVPEISGGDVFYIPKFITEELADEWHSQLIKLPSWYHPKLKLYGKEVTQSRSIAAYASDPDLTVKYSGHVVDVHRNYPPLLKDIQERIEDYIGQSFNHAMLNWYASGAEYIGKHRDTKENKIIASLSLGAVRTFKMSPNKSGIAVHKWKLNNGSLLIMSGDTQEHWKHEIPKELNVKESRISITFRQLSA